MGTVVFLNWFLCIHTALTPYLFLFAIKNQVPQHANLAQLAQIRIIFILTQPVILMERYVTSDIPDFCSNDT